MARKLTIFCGHLTARNKFLFHDAHNNNMAAAQVYKFNVEMTCEGCSGAVQRVLTKQKGEGVETFEIDLPNKIVVVTSTLTADQVLEIIKKTGKNTALIS